MIYWNGLGVFLATFCVLPIAIFGQTPTTTSSTPAPIGKLIDVGGYRVHLYCTGTGSPTAVILGAGFSFDWGLVQPEVWAGERSELQQVICTRSRATYVGDIATAGSNRSTDKGNQSGLYRRS